MYMVLYIVLADVIIDREMKVLWEIGKCGKSTLQIKKTQHTYNLSTPSSLNKRLQASSKNSLKNMKTQHIS